jgi:hypothetical protein
MEPVTLYRLDESNRVTSFSQPFKVSMFQFLNTIMYYNELVMSEVMLPPELLTLPEELLTKNISFGEIEPTTFLQKASFFLLHNGIRSFRTQALAAAEF